MKTRALGKTGLRLTELSFGGAGIGNLYRPVARDDAIATMQVAWDGGIRYFDTAPFYGQGLSERRTGDFLQGQSRDDFVLSTKVGRILRPAGDDARNQSGYVDALPFAIDYDYSYDGIMRSVEFSLARLGLSRIDILYVHDLERATLGGAAYQHHLRIFCDSGAAALRDLKADGTILAFGIGVNEVSACLDILAEVDLDAILLAGRYTLLDRSADPELIDLCIDRGTALVIGGVFNSGILATGAQEAATFNYAPASQDIRNRVRRLEDAAKAAGVPLASAAMQFPLRHDSVASVLIGTAKPGSMTRNLDQLQLNIPHDTWPAMEAIATAP